MNEFDDYFNEDHSNDEVDSVTQQYHRMIRANLRWQHLEGFIHVEFTEPSNDYMRANIRERTRAELLAEVESAFNS